jgi:predicted MFS family arabinose efflux permease
VVQILAFGSTYYLLTVLARPIVADTGWSYGTVIGGVSLGLLVAGLVSVRVGRIIERLGGRPVLAASSVLLAAGLALIGIAPGIEVYLLAWVVLGTGMGAGLYDASFAMLGRLYGTDARRAITAVTLWGGFASTVCWPLSAFLVESVGWRGACFVYAGMHLGLALPLNLLALPREARRPLRAASVPAGAGKAAGQGPAIFVLLAVIVTVAGMVAAVISVHLIAILQAGGLTLATAVGLGTLIGPSQVGARMLEALIGARLHPIWSLAAAAVLIAAGLVLLWIGAGLVAVAIIGYAAGNGILSIARGAVPLALFGAEGYAVLMGRLAMPALVAQALAPSAGALVMERAGAQVTLGALAVLALANLAAVAWLWRVSGVKVSGI